MLMNFVLGAEDMAHGHLHLPRYGMTVRRLHSMGCQFDEIHAIPLFAHLTQKLINAHSFFPTVPPFLIFPPLPTQLGDAPDASKAYGPL